MPSLPRAQLLPTHTPRQGEHGGGGEGGGGGGGGSGRAQMSPRACQAWGQRHPEHEEVQEHRACGFLLVRPDLQYMCNVKPS
jgi:hypothetical protein